jgi:hypothetical protein
MAVVSLSDASRQPTGFPAVTAAIIVVNVFAFALELRGGEAFVTRWSIIALSRDHAFLLFLKRLMEPFVRYQTNT